MNLTMTEVFGDLRVWEFIVIFSIAFVLRGLVEAIWEDVKKWKNNK